MGAVLNVKGQRRGSCAGVAQYRDDRFSCAALDRFGNPGDRTRLWCARRRHAQFSCQGRAASRRFHFVWDVSGAILTFAAC